MNKNDELLVDEIGLKIKEYSTFIDNTLYPRLKSAVEVKDKLEDEISEYKELSLKVKGFLEHPPTESLVDLGHKIAYCRAKIKNPQKIFVHVGMGFHIEMKLNEACEFIEKRIKMLETEILPLKVKDAQIVASHLENAIAILDALSKEMKK